MLRITPFLFQKVFIIFVVLPNFPLPKKSFQKLIRKIMKSLFIALLVLFIFSFQKNASAQNSFRYGASIDTIPFDGIKNYYEISDKCKLKATYIEGKVLGYTERLTVTYTCGENKAYETIQTELKTGDMVLSNGSEVKTGENSRAEFVAPDGTILRMGPNSTMTVDCNAQFNADMDKLSVKLVLGTIWSSVTKALQGEKMNIQTSNATAGVRGTIFSFELKLENGVYTNLLRVYEGSVEFNGNPESAINEEEIRSKSEQINADFKAGKISIEEYAKKMKEIGDQANNIASKYFVTVEAGNESYIRGTDPPTAPEQITQDSDPWFADKNFIR